MKFNYKRVLSSVPLHPTPRPLSLLFPPQVPPHLVHQISEGQEGYLIEGHGIQVVDIGFEGLVHGFQEADGLQVARGGYRESHHVPHSLVKARVGSISGARNDSEGLGWYVGSGEG